MINQMYELKDVTFDDLPKALLLAWNVFSEYEAPECSQEGIQEFKDFIDYEYFKTKYLTDYFMIGCFHQQKIVGITSFTINPPYHISLLFVDPAHHKQGIARSLFQKIKEHYQKKNECSKITVNSSPYAVEIYRKLGFTETNSEQIINGIRFTPMSVPLGY